jgi:hypothetical protein
MPTVQVPAMTLDALRGAEGWRRQQVHFVPARDLLGAELDEEAHDASPRHLGYVQYAHSDLLG